MTPPHIKAAVASDARSLKSAAPLWYRRSGFFDRQRRTMRATSCGTVSGSADGEACRMACMVSIGESSLKARRPVSIS